jgi:hypothetical protein
VKTFVLARIMAASIGMILVDQSGSDYYSYDETVPPDRDDPDIVVREESGF